MRILALLPFVLSLVALGCGTSDSDPGHGPGAGGTGGFGGEGGSGGEDGEWKVPTVAEVCELWAEGHVQNEKVPWTAGPSTCDPGTKSEVAVEDVLRRINMFRALAGLPSVSEDRGQREQTQACAVMMNANNALSHDPPPSWKCWSEEGAEGAASSNLALGYGDPSNAIDGLMGDVGVDSVGHRRWLLGYYLGKVGIGFAGKATCIGVFDDSTFSDRAWTAYPPEGPAPIEMVTSPWGEIPWSFHPADGIAGAEVSMQRLPGGEEVAIDSWIPDTGYRIPDAIVWQPPPVRAGESYRITITRPGKETVTYDVELVDCGSVL